MRSSSLFVALALTGIAASVAQAAPSVTVYTRDLGFVRETRTLDVTRDTVRIADVPERIDFGSVRVAPQGARVRRLAYRFDLASGDGLFETARGSRVRVTLPRDRVVEGTLVTYDGAWIVVRESDGTLRNLSRAVVEDVRLSASPRRLATRPELEVVLEGAKGSRVEAELSYLTGGLSWSADHTVVRASETSLTWSTAVTIENLTGRDYADAELKLVAGEPRRVAPSAPMPYMERSVMLQASKAGEGADLSQQDFSEYHLYSLSRPATLRDRERQTLTLVEPHTVKMTPRYLFKAQERRTVRIQYEVRNTPEQGLGMPLPAGRVRFHERDADGDLQFTGETTINHTAEGELMTLEVGDAFDLVGERRDVANRRISDREREQQVEIKLRNRKRTPVTIAVEEVVGGDIEVTQKSHDFTRKDANTLAWKIPVPAGQEAVLTYTVRIRY